MKLNLSDRPRFVFNINIYLPFPSETANSGLPDNGIVPITLFDLASITVELELLPLKVNTLIENAS